MKNASIDFAINPMIFSEEYRLIGKPDFIFHTFSSAKVVELKKRHYPSKYGWLDNLQVESCMLILGDESFGTVPNKLETDLRKKHIEGFVLYGNGVLKEVEPKNRDLIRLKASETVEMIKKHKSVSELPKPLRCNTYCSNIDYCIRKGVSPYENTIASPGGIEVQSLAYSARA